MIVEPHRNYEEEYDDALEFLMDEIKGRLERSCRQTQSST
jgi:hypothetical protein